MDWFWYSKTVPSDKYCEINNKVEPRSFSFCKLFYGTVHVSKRNSRTWWNYCFDVKHIHAGAKINPVRVRKDRFCKERVPNPLGAWIAVCRENSIKSSRMVPRRDKETHVKYGSGIVSAITAGRGMLSLAEYTFSLSTWRWCNVLPDSLSSGDSQYTSISSPKYHRSDAAFDAWYVYETCAFHGGNGCQNSSLINTAIPLLNVM